MHRGFTIIELLIAMCMAAILLAIAVPGVQQFLTASAVDQESNNLFNALHSARSQAISLNQDVVLCYANAGNVCVSNGYTHLLMFVDKNKDGALQTANADPDSVLLNGGQISNRVTINSAPELANFRFSREGNARTGSTLTLFNSDSGCHAKKVIVLLSGSAQICDSSDAGNNGCPSGNYCS